MQKCYKVIFCNYICQEFDILVLVLYSFDRSLWIYIYVCLFVCLSPSLSSNTYDCWPQVAYSMHWTPSVQKLWALWLNSFLSRKHKIEILDLIPVVMCNVSWISLHFSSPKPLLKIQTIQQVLVFADVHEIII